MTVDEETQKIAENVKSYSDYPVIQFRVGDLMEVAGHKYQIRIAWDNTWLLAPYREPPSIKVSIV